MSDIITTIIMIALALVAVGIVWGVVSNALGKASSDATSNAACLQTKFEIVSTTNDVASGNVSVVFKRTMGNDNLAGVQVIAVGNDSVSNSVKVNGNIGIAEQKASPIIKITAGKALSKVIISPIVNTSSTTEVVCGTATEKTF